MIKTNWVYIVYSTDKVKLNFDKESNKLAEDWHKKICDEFKNITEQSNAITGPITSYQAFEFLKKSSSVIEEFSQKFLRETGAVMVKTMVENSLKSHLSQQDKVRVEWIPNYTFKSVDISGKLTLDLDNKWHDNCRSDPYPWDYK